VSCLSDSTTRDTLVHDKRDSHDPRSWASPQCGLRWTNPCHFFQKIDANPEHRRLTCTRERYCFFVLKQAARRDKLVMTRATLRQWRHEWHRACRVATSEIWDLASRGVKESRRNIETKLALKIKDENKSNFAYARSKARLCVVLRGRCWMTTAGLIGRLQPTWQKYLHSISGFRQSLQPSVKKLFEGPTGRRRNHCWLVVEKNCKGWQFPTCQSEHSLYRVVMIICFINFVYVFMLFVFTGLYL